MLQNEVTTYQEDYYQVKGAEMHPAPVQRPRPPLTLAALGSKSLKIAARYANSWNSLADPDMSVQQALETTRWRNEVLGIAPTGRRVTGMIFYRISEGGISEYWGSWDRMGLLQQLDAQP